MINRLKGAAVAVAVVLLASCASNDIGHLKDVNQDEVHQGITVYYDEHENKTEVKVFLRFAGPTGTTLQVDSGASVKLDGVALNENLTSMAGCYYNKTVSGKMPRKEYVLGFTDCKGKTYTNRFKWNNIELDSVPTVITRKDGLKIFFADDPEGRKEDITVEVQDSAQTVSETFEHVRRERIVFPKDKLQNLHGRVEIRVARHGSFSLQQQAHAGGYLNTTYTLAPRMATIID